MKKKIFLTALIIALTFTSVASSAAAANPSGEKLFQEAQGLEKETKYYEALDVYKKAIKELRKANKSELVTKSLYAITRLEKIKMTYPYTRDQVAEQIEKQYPETTGERLDQIFEDGRLPHLTVGYETYYFADFLNTLYHIYPEFRTKEQPGALGKSTEFFKVMSKYIYEKDTAKPGQTLFNPIRYLADGQVSIPRDKLAKKGTLKVWLPLPLVTAAQPEVEILSIYPEKYIKYPIKLDGDIGLVYMEIPLAEVKDDLKIGTKFKFTHYEERFKVDLKNIGEYDIASPLYKRYTTSDQNITITPAISAAAKKLAGSETNPYKIAKKFFDHIVWDLDYSFTPHAALEALKEPESVFVHEHGYGDCGAQSMYFAALCRSMGIPARAAGGMQLFPMNEAGCGDHFWAQIYLPNYGWIPVDTSVAQLGRYLPGWTKKQQLDFAEYFYGKMDPLRYLIQVDADIPLIPEPDGPLAFGMVLQDPTAICAEMDENPGLFLMDNWEITIKPFD
ncbi:MAG: transglutaminase domain-containing protein [Candidatus Margulisiibacteriota bacterium]